MYVYVHESFGYMQERWTRVFYGLLPSGQPYALGNPQSRPRRIWVFVLWRPVPMSRSAAFIRRRPDKIQPVVQLRPRIVKPLQVVEIDQTLNLSGELPAVLCIVPDIMMVEAVQLMIPFVK